MLRSHWLAHPENTRATCNILSVSTRGGWWVGMRRSGSRGCAEWGSSTSMNSSRSGIRSRLFFRERGRGRSGSFGFLQWQAFSSKRESVSWTAEHHRKMPLKYVDEKTLLRGLVLRWSGENGRSTLKRGRHPRPRPMATAVVRGEQVGLPPAGSAPATGHMSLYYSTTADSGRDQASDFIRDWHMSKLHVKPFTNSNA